MSLQVLHEAEHTRQHSRYQIPASVEIDGKTYATENWSVGGVAIKNIADINKQFVKARLTFDFGSFHTVIDVNLERRGYSKDGMILGCSFSDLDKDKLSVLHYIVNAYLAGEVTTTGSLIEILKKDRYTKKDMSKVLNPDMSKMEKFALRTKQVLIYTGLTAVVFGLISFISFSAYNKIFVVKSLSASIDAPIVVIRAPQPSYYTAMAFESGAEVHKGDLLASMKLIGGGVNSIESPAQGSLLTEYVLDRSFVDIGEPLMSILPEGANTFIMAKIAVKDTSKLALGQIAKVQLASGDIIQARIQDIKSANSVSSLHSSPLERATTSTFEYIKVSLEPLENIGIEHLGEVVSVNIDTF